MFGSVGLFVLSSLFSLCVFGFCLFAWYWLLCLWPLAFAFALAQRDLIRPQVETDRGRHHTTTQQTTKTTQHRQGYETIRGEGGGDDTMEDTHQDSRATSDTSWPLTG